MTEEKDRLVSAQAFTSLFPGLDRAHGIWTPAEDEPGQGDGETVKRGAGLADYMDHLDGKRMLGIVPVDDDGMCKFGCINVEEEVESLSDIFEKIHALELPLWPARSKSGKVHLWFFLPQMSKARKVQELLQEWAIALGIAKCDIFPKQVRLANRHDNGTWIILPYFGGKESAGFYKFGENLALFDGMVQVQIGLQSLDNCERIITEKDQDLIGAPPCLRIELARGKVANYRRGAVMHQLGVFYKKSRPDKWLGCIDEANRTYLQEQLSSEEIEEIKKNLKKKSADYLCAAFKEVCAKGPCRNLEHGMRGGAGDPGVDIKNLVKISTQPASYRMEINGHSIIVNSTDDLLDQQKFRNLCVENLKILPDRIKPDAWMNMWRILIAEAVEISAPEDASELGQVISIFNDWVGSRGKSRDRVDLLRGKPVLEEDYILFRSQDFVKYAKRQGLRLQARDLYTELNNYGITSDRGSIKGRTVRWWAMPDNGEEQESFTAPEIRPEDI